jgi:hypothetical protein
MSKTYIIDWVDPPEGWMHGFPKKVDEAYFNMGEDKTQWYLDNGYPKDKIDKGLLEYCRAGFVEVLDEV